MPSTQLTPRQAAELVGVSESTVRRWCDSKALEVVKTMGGHRRIDRVVLLAFARERGLTLVDSAAASTAGRGGRLSSDAELVGRLYDLLVAGDTDAVRQFVGSLIDRSGDVPKLCDQIVAPAMHRLGEQWSEGSVRVFQEHAAMQIMQSALWGARSHISLPKADGPVAICASLSGDPYSLGPIMAGLVLQQVGFKTSVLGPNNPAPEVLAAAAELNAAIVAISVATVPSIGQRAQEFKELSEGLEASGARLVAGGRELSTELRRRIQPDFFGDTMAHLAAYGRRTLDR